MDCPKCKTVELRASDFSEPFSCNQCRGTWISNEEISKLSVSLLHGDSDKGGADNNSNDQKTGLCPNGHGIMVRAKVDVEDPFYLEKCTRCGGIWFDKGELKRITETQLVTNIADFWTQSWQRKHRKEKDRESFLEMNEKLFGDDTFNLIMQLAEQLKSHPEKTRALALLKEEML